MKDASIPVTLIVVGLLWLLWQLRWLPDFDWVVTLGFVAGGIALMVIDGLNKHTVVMGPFLIAAGGAWFIHHRFFVGVSLVVPCMMVLLGGLMLVARHPAVPERRSAAPQANPQ